MSTSGSDGMETDATERKNTFTKKTLKPEEVLSSNIIPDAKFRMHTVPLPAPNRSAVQSCFETMEAVFAAKEFDKKSASARWMFVGPEVMMKWMERKEDELPTSQLISSETVDLRHNGLTFRFERNKDPVLIRNASDSFEDNSLDHPPPMKTAKKLFRKSFQICREIRDACQTVIDKTVKYIEPWNLNVFEEWEESNEIGVIGLEGSDEETLEQVFSEMNLSDRFSSLSIVGEPKELFHGIGEAYVRWVAEEFNVLVDFDKYGETVEVFGEKNAEAIEEMEQFVEKKDHIEVSLSIPIAFSTCPQLLRAEDIEALGAALHSECRLVPAIVPAFQPSFQPSAIEFKGSVTAYETLVAQLKKLNTILFNKAVPASVMNNFGCPACGALVIGDNEDFYRQSCGHTMCFDCCRTKMLVALKAADFKTSCDLVDCDYVWGPQDYLKVILGDSRRVKAMDESKLKTFMKSAQWSVLWKDEDVETCPQASCPGLLIRHTGKRRLRCSFPSCQFIYCGDCLKESHGNQPCNSPEGPQSLQDFQLSNAQSEKMMQCPKCKKMWQRLSGCDHMQCFCGQHFCWRCGFAAEDSDDYNRHQRQSHQSFPRVNREGIAVLHEIGG